MTDMICDTHHIGYFKTWCNDHDDDSHSGRFWVSTLLHSSLHTKPGGLAHADPAEVRMVAARSIQLYDSSPNSPGSQHMQSRRFCDESFKGFPGDTQDVPLRPLIIRLANGSATLESLLDENTPQVRNLLHRLSGFRLAKDSVTSAPVWHYTTSACVVIMYD